MASSSENRAVNLADSGSSLSTIYGWTAVAAAGLALLSFAVTRRQRSPQPATSKG